MSDTLLLSTAAVAGRLGISVHKIWWLVRSKQVEPPTTRFGKSLVWNAADVERLRAALSRPRRTRKGVANAS
jgi:hypothetical protein